MNNNIIGIAAGVLTSISLLPQLVKMVQEKKATDISLPMLLLLMAGLSLWAYYGILQHDWPIIVTNIFSLVVNVIIIVLRWHYKQKGAE